jgi:hypothetical protein
LFVAAKQSWPATVAMRIEVTARSPSATLGSGRRVVGDEMPNEPEDIATRTAREAHDLEQQRRRGPSIDFGDLQLGGESRAFGFRFGWPEFLGFLAFWLGMLLGDDNRWTIAPFAAIAVWLPLRLAISGSQYILGLFGRHRDGAPKLPPIIAWPILGLAEGAALGVAVVSMLGGDIAPMEGIVMFAPIGLLIGAIVGFIRRKR